MYFPIHKHIGCKTRATRQKTLTFLLEADILSTCCNKNDVTWHDVWLLWKTITAGHVCLYAVNYYKKFELMLTRRAKAYSMLMLICNLLFSRKTGQHRKIATFTAVPFLMLSCAGFLKPKKSRLEPLKSTFNAENLIRSLSMSISIGLGAIRS